ncbi:hypothetical protein [Kiritimatiella glycovorans]|uniref:Glycosyl hydrolases family 2, sugar binding domain n=1 Tax=Kiritimatiella glycovorans TaxID=1307763 RepID=A0A0G3EDD5_9BACT|nr:hypothetical protein [Kiritimatiella glycovorans]AKJ64481.1 Glycosyl hydrolases family 2, sugar binding domain [Kiritimatiella glycovorans]
MRQLVSGVMFLSVLTAAVVFAADDERAFYESDAFTVYQTSVTRDGKRAYLDPDTGALVSEAEFRFNRKPERPAEWTPQHDLSPYPSFRSEYPIVDAVYNLAMDNILVHLDYAWPNESTVGLFNASEGRPLWVRDTAYSVMGSLPLFQEGARKSLEWCLHKGEGIKPEQMYGIVGFHINFPTVDNRYSMTDFLIWIEGAWQYALASGDVQFLKDHYVEMTHSAELVRSLHFDPYDGLYHGGETIGDGGSIYPEGATGRTDLKGSSVNFIHYRTQLVLGEIADWIGRPVEEAERYRRRAYALKDAVNRELWLEEKRFFSLLKMGRDTEPLGRSTLSGNSFALLWNGINDPARVESIIDHVPDTPWGAPLTYPPYLNRGAYHDQNVWPMMDGFWGAANARADNPERMVKTLALLTWDGAFHHTMSEMWGLFDGDPRGKYPQLWSCTAFLLNVYQGLLGAEALPQGMLIEPSVPEEFAGGFEIAGFPYGKATWTFRVRGEGTRVASFKIDGKPSINILPRQLEGDHVVEIEMTKTLPFGITQPPMRVAVNGDALELEVRNGGRDDLGAVVFAAPDLAPQRFEVSRGTLTLEPRELRGNRTGTIRYMLYSRDGKGQPRSMGPMRTLELRRPTVARWAPGVYDTSRPIESGTFACHRLVVRNEKQTEENCKVRVETPAGLRVEKAVHTLHVPAGSEADVKVSWEATAELDYGRHTIRAEIIPEHSPIFYAEIPVLVEEAIKLRGTWCMHEHEEGLEGASMEINDRDGRWPIRRLPRRWQRCEGFENSEGPLWYRKHVLVPTVWDGHDAELFFGEIDGYPTVYVNETELEQIPSRPKTFRYRVPAELLQYGANNLIAVFVEQGANPNKSGLCGWPMELRVLPASEGEGR